MFLCGIEHILQLSEQIAVGAEGFAKNTAGNLSLNIPKESRCPRESCTDTRYRKGRTAGHFPPPYQRSRTLARDKALNAIRQRHVAKPPHQSIQETVVGIMQADLRLGLRRQASWLGRSIMHSKPIEMIAPSPNQNGLLRMSLAPRPLRMTLGR